jgi:hypothetical protein
MCIFKNDWCPLQAYGIHMEYYISAFLVSSLFEQNRIDMWGEMNYSFIFFLLINLFLSCDSWRSIIPAPKLVKGFQMKWRSFERIRLSTYQMDLRTKIRPSSKLFANGGKPAPLFSEGLSPLAVDSQPLQGKHFFSSKSFDDLSLEPKLQHILESHQIVRPSRIQALAFQPIYDGHHVLMGDQTGSGKTLAYLLPILQKVFFSSTGSYNFPVLSGVRPREPVIVIMTPTTELAQ